MESVAKESISVAVALQDEEKARIRAEEIFRAEVRRELEVARSPASRAGRLWKLANSAFGLWLLSSVALAGLTTIFTAYQNHRTEEMQRTRTEQRIVTEVSNRIVQALAGLRLDDAGIRNGETFYPKDIYNNVVLYLNNSFDRDFSIYPEYRQRNFRSLMIELVATTSPPERLRLKESLRAFEQLVDLASVRGEPVQESPTQERERSLEAVRNATDIVKARLLGDYLKSSIIPELHDVQQDER